MAKRRRKDKELARLRREVEVLRAQLAGQGKKETEATKATEATEVVRAQKPTKKSSRTPLTIQTVDPKFIKADLLKSGILTLIALGAIVALTIIL